MSQKFRNISQKVETNYELNCKLYNEQYFYLVIIHRRPHKRNKWCN